MKLRYIFTALVATLALATGCEKANNEFLDEIQVSSSYVSLPVGGGSTTITVTATDNWSFDNGIPEWLTISPSSGSAGQANVTFSAAATTVTNTCTVFLACKGKTQRINVIQQAEKTELPITSVSDVLTKGVDATTYKVKGTCTKISSTSYGNWYVNDGSCTDDLYIYGTVDATGAYNWSSFNIEVGDIVTVEGPRTTYNGTIELVDATFISVEKSLIKCDSLTIAGVKATELPIEGGQIVANLTCKGKGISVEIPAEAQDWLQVVGINTATNKVTFAASNNPSGDRSIDVTFKTTDGSKDYTAVATIAQKGAIIDTDCAGVIEGTDGFLYRISGYVSKITNAKYGNYLLKDASGEILIYGTNDWASQTIKEGDVVTVVGAKKTFGSTIELVDVDVANHCPVTEVSVADFLAKDEDETLYRLTGTVSDLYAAKGRFNITDATGTVYAYNVAPGYGGSNTDFASTGVEDGDIVTIIGTRGSWDTTIEVTNGFFVSKKEITEWSIDLAYAKGENAYDDGAAVINGEEVKTTLKIGTGSKVGSFTLTVPAGSTKITYYAVAWAGAATTIDFSIDGTSIGTQAIADNAGATGSAPYTMTVAATDKYELAYSFTTETQVKVTTATGAAKRAIFFGIKAE